MLVLDNHFRRRDRGHHCPNMFLMRFHQCLMTLGDVVPQRATLWFFGTCSFFIGSLLALGISQISFFLGHVIGVRLHRFRRDVDAGLSRHLGLAFRR